ncbi:heterokaryon incompatibility protein-domain-containing protein [Echria macrotheca]|uniref:Heterokaryon incompatibility protein-domain-containing protein n=1 Tax=Echria macrotheca TaxID=438768 RepID=A0AAJ0BBT8_9PEZI|nr:heterokaryon incompatibility protein-domain-containing protein [Echria macrotheca]
MGLINVHTLELEEFVANPPSYAILSHTWAVGEVSFQDFGDPNTRITKPGFNKISWTCKQAIADGLRYAWVDTCCIDKSSSAELGEAINSMFRWYRDSSKCYVYLEDVSKNNISPVQTSIKHSRWLTRGWTLQELIAPRAMDFFDGLWQFIGTKEELVNDLSQFTGIDIGILRGASLRTVCVGARMKWAAFRKTTREEDIAYCLMGLFDVNMPMMYGEGSKAFQRLQEEIIREYDDHTIFAWQSEPGGTLRAPCGFLAVSPSDFAGFGPVRPFSVFSQDPRHDSFLTLTNRGIRMTARFIQAANTMFVIPNCVFNGDARTEDKYLAIGLRDIGGNQYARDNATSVRYLTLHSSLRAETKTLYLVKGVDLPLNDQWDGSYYQHAFVVRAPGVDLVRFGNTGFVLYQAEGATVQLKEHTQKGYNQVVLAFDNGADIDEDGNSCPHIVLGLTDAGEGEYTAQVGFINSEVHERGSSLGNFRNKHRKRKFKIDTNDWKSLTLKGIDRYEGRKFRLRAKKDLVFGYDAFVIHINPVKVVKSVGASSSNI